MVALCGAIKHLTTSNQSFLCRSSRCKVTNSQFVYQIISNSCTFDIESGSQFICNLCQLDITGENMKSWSH